MGDQVALFDVPPVAAAKQVLHPGWACCDPSQDLAGWLERERQAVDALVDRARHLHRKGRVANRVGIRVGPSTRRGQALDGLSRAIHGTANAHGQEALIRSGRATRVESAHLFRLADVPRQFGLEAAMDEAADVYLGHAKRCRQCAPYLQADSRYGCPDGLTLWDVWAAARDAVRHG